MSWELPKTLVLETLDGNVQSQGIKVSHRDWLDMGSENWNKTPNNIKAFAYQAALSTGWCDDALIQNMISTYSHLDENVLKITLSDLQELSKKFPACSEEIKTNEIDLNNIPFNNGK